MKKFVLQLTKSFAQITMVCAILCIFLGDVMGQVPRLTGPHYKEFTKSSASEQTWTVPDGVTKLRIEAVGAGGAGGYRVEIPTWQTANYEQEWSTGGGGGGAYARVNELDVKTGDRIIVIVGEGGVCTSAQSRHGGNTEVYKQELNSDLTFAARELKVKAAGGKSVGNNRDKYGKAGGKVADCVGEVKHNGGNGGNGYYNKWYIDYPIIGRRWYGAINTTSSGAGGGAGGPDGDGGNGTNGAENLGMDGGLAGPGWDKSGNGAGGKAGSNQDGGAGGNYGGGGSGGNSNWVNESANGGKGGDGFVRITYYVNECYNGPKIVELVPPADKCAGFSEYDVTAQIQNGNGTLTYTWTGDAHGANNIGAIHPSATNNCGETYNYSLTVIDELNCESDPATGSFTITNPTMAFQDDIIVEANEESGHFYVPNIASQLPSYMTDGCGNGLSIVNVTPAIGEELTAPSTIVIYKVQDICGNQKDVRVSVVTDGSIVPPSPGGSFTLSLTANKERLCAGEQATLTATANGGTAPITYTWSGTGLLDGGADNIKKTTATSTLSSTESSAVYSVTARDNAGNTATATITIYTNPVAADAADVDAGAQCSPFDYTYTVPTAPANTLYSWQISSNTGVEHATAFATPQPFFFAYGLDNTALESKTVTYTVTPVTSTGGTMCAGSPFDITITIKPSIENDAAFSFTATDVTCQLYYGMCDTLLTIDIPTYTTNITEYASSLTATPSMGTINSDGKLEVRLSEGETTITWTITDPCGHSIERTQKVTVTYPPCTGTVSDGSGNSYEVVRVGCECWTKTNLKAEKYDSEAGGGDIASAEGYYSSEYPNTDENIDKFGRLYTWYSAVNVAEGDDSAEPTLTEDGTSHIKYVQGICPDGWAIPTEYSYQNAFIYAGSAEALKTEDATLWLPGKNGTNTSGFTAVGAGYYDSNIDRYVNLLGETNWWNDESVSVSNAACSSITHSCPYVLSKDMNKHFGLSVRCVRRAN